MNYLICLIKKRRLVKFIRLDPWYRFYFSENKKVFDYSDKIKKTESEIGKFNKNDINGYRELLKFSEKYLT